MPDDAVGVRAVAGRIAADVTRADRRPLLVGLTGGHAAGKGRVAACLTAGLVERGYRVALVAAAPWRRPLQHFRGAGAVERYHRAGFRWGPLFDTVVTPLQRTRSLSIRVRPPETPPERSGSQGYEFRDVDVILLVGVFLLLREFRERYDSVWWVEENARAALRRVIHRSRLERNHADLVDEYRRLFFPADRLHFATEQPVAAADGVIAPGSQVSPLLRCTATEH